MLGWRAYPELVEGPLMHEVCSMQRTAHCCYESTAESATARADSVQHSSATISFSEPLADMRCPAKTCLARR